ncbi:MAG: hypothetical protein K6E15_05650 [Prevotella sp.]|nr:hypothetical protein [Prevotella sp.]
MMKENIEKVKEFAIRHMKMGKQSIHGIDHWDRVARNGEALNVPGADMEVVSCFAYLHDVERQFDAYDVEHGPMAAELIGQIRESVLGFLDDKQIGLLKDACTFHTTVLRTGNPTIDTCFDADRLDLPRVGITPDPDRMATKEGAEKARQMRAEFSSQAL